MMQLPLWEYQLIEVEPGDDPGPVQDTLNKMGSDGWQPHGVIPNGSSGPGGWIILARISGMVQMAVQAPQIVPVGMQPAGSKLQIV